VADELRYIPFLREVGRHFSVNRMLTMESVRQRLEREQSFSFLEFNYMLLQSYDFLELHRRHGVALQMGGSDQWGNIVLGADLVRRMDAAEAFGLTTPLVTMSSGAKMGKTAAGAVWLNAERVSAYDYWQFWRNTEDADVGRFLGLFTELPMPEVARLAALGGAEVNEAKKLLATEATALLHGRAAAEAAAETARQAFEEGANVATLPSITADLSSGVPVVQLAQLAAFTKSNGEGRRAVDNASFSINGVVVTDPARVVTMADLQDGVLRFSFGKKRHILVRPA
jgi:tyrosyl-tRNA synthetase